MRQTDWSVLPEAGKGTLFLRRPGAVCLADAGGGAAVASWETAFSLGFISAIFDNIPLTALALNQGGYDWGILAYAVGFGGSMVWFGSSAGVAVSNLFPDAKSVTAWLRAAWWLPAGLCHRLLRRCSGRSAGGLISNPAPEQRWRTSFPTFSANSS